MNLLTIFNEQLALRSGKWSEYFDVYETHFEKFVGKAPTVVEVGVERGGSLEMWLKYFGPDAKIYGIDNTPQIENVEGVHLIHGDQGNPEFWDKFLETVPSIDVFVDDGSHINSHQILTFCKVWPKISPNGVFICEDMHTSYWSEYGGGLQKSGTFIEFAKQMIDCLNMDHLRNVSPAEHFKELTKEIKSIMFYDGQVVFTKGKKKNIMVSNRE